MIKPKITVLDYGSGNVHSACRALEEVGAQVTLTADRQQLLESDGLVIPGVGAFSSVMEKLRSAGAASIIDKRISASRPVFGICVGMQVMFETGFEHGVETAGLGQWPGEVTMLDAPVLPHMGWSKVTVDSGSKLFAGIEDERFYFVHSYAAKKWNLDIRPPFVPASLTWSHHGEDFLAAIENGPLTATQFHPEKSGEAGLRLLRNWINGLGA